MISHEARESIRIGMEIISAIRDTIDWFDKRRREAYEEAEEWQEEYADEVTESEPPIALP